MLEEGQMILGEQIKPEMHQSMVEVGTGVCKNVKEARADVIKLRRAIAELAHKKDWPSSPLPLIRSRTGPTSRSPSTNDISS